MSCDDTAFPGPRTVAVLIAATVAVAVGWLGLRATTSSDLAPRRDSGVNAGAWSWNRVLGIARCGEVT